MKVPVDVQAELMGVSATATAAMSIATPAAAGGPRTTRVPQSSTRVVAMTATTTTVVGTAAGTALFAARIVATRVAGSPAALAVVFLVIFMFLVFIGLFFAMAALVAWMQKVAQKYLALKELQVLTGEYIVKDLSELEKQYSNGQDLEQGNVGPSAHRAPMWVPMMPQEVQINLYRDLQAVYGMESR